MIQDIYPHKMHNEFRPDAVAGPGSTLLLRPADVPLLLPASMVFTPLWFNLRHKAASIILGQFLGFVNLFKRGKM